MTSVIEAGADPGAIVVVSGLTLAGLLIIVRTYTIKGRSGTLRIQFCNQGMEV